MNIPQTIQHYAKIMKKAVNEKAHGNKLNSIEKDLHSALMAKNLDYDTARKMAFAVKRDSKK